MTEYESKVKRAAAKIRERLHGVVPSFGVTLGSGLGRLSETMDIWSKIGYSNIPYAPQTTVEGHTGELLIGTLGEVPIIGLSGRKHYYEVADQRDAGQQITFLVHTLAELGVENYFVTNAAGGLNLDYEVGDVMSLKSHISLIPDPLLGRKLDFLTVDGKDTPRFTPMNQAYDAEHLSYLNGSGVNHVGTYLAVTGPSYETSAECLAFRLLGADAVGMSTAPEVVAARNRGMRCVGFSCITNKIDKYGNNTASHDEVKSILDSEATRGKLEDIVLDFFSFIRKTL